MQRPNLLRISRARQSLLVGFSLALQLAVAACSKSAFDQQYGHLFENPSRIEIRDSDANIIVTITREKEMNRLIDLTSLDSIAEEGFRRADGLPTPPEYVVGYRLNDPSAVDQHIWIDSHDYVYYMVTMSSIYKKRDPAYCAEVRRIAGSRKAKSPQSE